MFLSRLLINLGHRVAQRSLSDRYELHRTVYSAFPERMPTEERILYRLEVERQQPYGAVLVQSQTLPNWNQSRCLTVSRYLFESPVVRLIQPQIQGGVRLPFRLQANPTVKWYGKRYAISDDDRLMDWLRQKGEAHGYAVDTWHVRIGKPGKAFGKRGRQTWYVVQFDGALEVVTVEAFSSALLGGIGSGKGFGCGLLSVPYPLADTVAEAYSPLAWG